MQKTVPTDGLAAQVARLAAEMDSLDRGLVDAGLIASTVLARADALETLIRVALRTAGLDDEADADQASYADPMSSRVQARKRRIEKSGLRLIAGGGSR